MRVTPNCDSINSFYISRASGIQSSPDLAFGGGNYMVVWSDGRTTFSCIYASRVTPSGNVLDPGGIQVGAAITASQILPMITFTGTRFFVIWGYATTPFAFTGRFLETNGQVGDTTRICTADDKIYGARCAYDGSKFLISWIEASGPTLKGQLIAGDGSPIGSPFVIASAVSNMSLGLCFDGTNFVVTYALKIGNFYQVWGRKYDRNAVPVGPAFSISSSTNDQRHGDIIPGANNRYLNVWSEYHFASYSYGIFANIDIVITAVEESQLRRSPRFSLKSSLVRDAILLTGACGEEVSILDAAGRVIGKTKEGYFDCRRLKSGVYFVKAPSTGAFKVVKIE